MNNDFDLIRTKKSRTRYHFVKPQEKGLIDRQPVDTNLTYYYQIAMFPGLTTDKYHMRKFVINCSNEFVAIYDYYLSKKQCKKFIDSKKPQEYKTYGVYSLEGINYPSLSDLLLSKSNILSKDFNYSGYAPFG